MTKSHLISCRRPTRPMPTAYTRTYTRIRIRTHSRTHLHTQANTHVYTPVKCAPPPPPTKAHFLLADAPGGCMSVCVYCCLSMCIRVYVYLYTHLLTYKNLGIPPILLSSVPGSSQLCEADSNDFVVQSSVEWGMSIYSSLRATYKSIASFSMTFLSMAFLLGLLCHY